MVNALPSGLAVSPRAAANLKRSLVLALVCGGLALLVLGLLGHPLAGAFVFVGLAFGVLNTWLTQRSVVRFGARQTKGPFVIGVIGRLMILSVAALGAAFLFRPDGLGVLGGLAIFQVIVLLGAAIPVFRELKS